MNFWLTEVQHPNGTIYAVSCRRRDSSSKPISEDDAVTLWQQAKAEQMDFSEEAANWIRFQVTVNRLERALDAPPAPEGT